MAEAHARLAESDGQTVGQEAPPAQDSIFLPADGR